MGTLKQKLIFLGILIITYPLVIGDVIIRSFTYPVIVIFIPILVYSILLKYKPFSILIKSVIIIAGFVYGLFFLFFLLGFALCADGNTQDRYLNKENSNIKIVGHDFSCFGTTGDLVLYKQFSISKSIKLQVYYKTFVDYRDIKIDTAVWKRIEK